MEDFPGKIHQLITKGTLPPKLGHSIEKFYQSYKNALDKNDKPIEDYRYLFDQFLDIVLHLLEKPFTFEPYHKSITSPYNYYNFGINFIRPLIIFEKSSIFHLENVDKMQGQLAKGENVILLANHQTEPDPQVISLMLEKTHPQLAENIIFVAGHRVVSDPLAVPFSKGCNLICIFSKKHVEHPPEKKEEKLLHNQRTMKKLSQLLTEGGKCIYVAPSGGRDRPNDQGTVEVAPFDPQSLEMFWLIAQQSGTPTHFYPLALSTYNLLPPPNSVEKELGERRYAQCSPVHLSFGSEIDMSHIPGIADVDKRQKRKVRAEYIWNLVKEDYQRLTSGKKQLRDRKEK